MSTALVISLPCAKIHGMDYKEALAFLNSLQSKGIRPSLRDIAKALARFGHPQLKFPSLHIAGTNGKGSTAAFLSSILTRAGYKVGLFISPHLHSVRERIQINGQPISKEDFALFVQELKDHLSVTLTYFEFLTLLGFFYFATQGVEVAVIETGLGGRLDATNLLQPEITIITNVGLEHEHWLGHSLKKIALEKAGIVKEGVPLVTGIKQKTARHWVEAVCALKQAPFYRLGKDFRYRKNGFPSAWEAGLTFHYYGLNWHFKHLQPGLLGLHQIKNATLALGALEVLSKKDFTFTASDIRLGLKETVWPARFEIVRKSPWVVLDGAHNPDGMRALRVTLKALKFENLILVIGVMQDKRVKGMLRLIAPLATYVITTAPNMPRAMKPELLKKLAAAYCPHVNSILPLKAAIEKALTLAKNKDLVLITGSLYTVAAARELFLSVEKD